MISPVHRHDRGPGRDEQSREWSPGIVRLDGWGGFAAWAVVGALFSFSVLGAASIGLFVFPVALLALFVALWLVRAWPGIASGIVGLASLILLVGILNLGSTPCPSSGSGMSYGGPGTGAMSTSCGGWDPVPWLLVGVVLAGAGFSVYALARSRTEG